MSRLLVTSASGSNGNGYGAILSFASDGDLIGLFSEDSRISDPRGMTLHPSSGLLYVNSGPERVLALNPEGAVTLDSGRIDGLDPGGAVFGPDGRYYVTLRRRNTILGLPANLDDHGTPLLSDGVVSFPRGFAFGSGGEVYFSSGTGPSGEGDNTIAVFSPDGARINSHLVYDPELSPLDLTVAPNGNLVVNSEWPFGSPDAKATVREYRPSGGELVRVLSSPATVGFAKPRGLRLTHDDRLYCVGKDHVVAFQFSTGAFLGVVAQLTGLNGQAIVVVR